MMGEGRRRRRRTTTTGRVVAKAAWRWFQISRCWFSLLLLLLISNVSSVSIVSAASSSAHRDEPSFLDTIMFEAENRQIKCRVILVETILEATGGYLRSERETACIPILTEDKESDDSLRINLPDIFVQSNLKDITQGELYLLIRGARQTRHEVLLTGSSEFSIVDPPIPPTDEQAQKRQHRRHRRHLVDYDPSSTTQLTVAVMRVSAVDSQLAKTASEIDTILFNNSGINFISQYDACSFGKLKWQRSSYGVVDVKLNKTIAELENDSAVIVTMALEQVKIDLGLESAAAMADHVMVCLPPGTGEWAANAGVNFWRSQYNSEWCTSLTANMHELGHNLGLLHANEAIVLYGDNTGYMAAGYTNTEWPRRCFNGQNHWYLGFYESRRQTLDPLTAGPTLIRLAAFVDFDKSTAPEPVLVKVADRFYMQFNRAKGINQDTGEKRDQVTITEMTPEGSDCVAGITVGEQFTSSISDGETPRQLVFHVCESESGGASSADVMIVSVALETSICTFAESPKKDPSTIFSSFRSPSFVAPSKTASHPPDIILTSGPTAEPSESPEATRSPSTPPIIGQSPTMSKPVKASKPIPSQKKDFQISEVFKYKEGPTKRPKSSTASIDGSSDKKNRPSKSQPSSSSSKSSPSSTLEGSYSNKKPNPPPTDKPRTDKPGDGEITSSSFDPGKIPERNGDSPSSRTSAGVTFENIFQENQAPAPLNSSFSTTHDDGYPRTSSASRSPQAAFWTKVLGLIWLSPLLLC